MKKFRTLSAIAAAAMAVSMIPVSASAEDTTYHAYIGVQSASYSFRNAWYEPTYGQGVTGDDGMVYFDQITGWDGPTAVSKGGVFNDAEITGDGTYTVSVTDFDFGSDESLNLLFISTDIPLDSGVTISDVKVTLDGNTKYTFDEAYLSPDFKDYLEPMCINIWNDDLGKEDGLFGYTMPENSIELTFTVSGLVQLPMMQQLKMQQLRKRLPQRTQQLKRLRQLPLRKQQLKRQQLLRPATQQQVLSSLLWALQQLQQLFPRESNLNKA